MFTSRKTAGISVLVMLMLAGCQVASKDGASAPALGKVSSAAAEDFPTLEVDAICRLGAGCCGANGIAMDVGTCSAVFAGGFEGELAGVTPDMVAAGTVVYDDAQAQACLAAIDALGCAVLGDPATKAAIATCAAVYTGVLAAGDACTASVECQAGNFCDVATGTCAALRAAGDPCATSDECSHRASADICDTDVAACGPRRADGAACVASAECASSLCDGGVCVSAVADYFGVDRCVNVLAGAPVAPAGPCGAGGPLCEDDEACATGADCMSGFCSPKSRTCVSGSSCAIGAGDSVAGIETCGAGETTAAPLHQSCCRSLPLPATPGRRLDKYELTAGRMRRFVSSVTAQYGTTNIRRWVYEYGAANPDSQLGYMTTYYPSVVDILPNSSLSSAKPPLAVHLGAFPVDPMNALDGCYVGTGGYGHATYHQATNVLSGYGIPARKFSQATLDEKPMNCAMTLMYMAFCAWDGGELAAATDYREVWGRNLQRVGTTNVFIPWENVLSVGDFSWRNGQNGTFNCLVDWPGCVPYSANPADPVQQIFYRYPTRYAAGGNIYLPDDTTPLFPAPGRFQLDATRITSANGESWMDIGGLNLETGWVPNPPDSPSGAISDICDVSSRPAPGEIGCVRQGQNGVLRHSGPLPHLPLFGYSWEGHARYNDTWLGNNTQTLGSWKPVTFQYGKVGARCARNY